MFLRHGVYKIYLRFARRMLLYCYCFFSFSNIDQQSYKSSTFVRLFFSFDAS